MGGAPWKPTIYSNLISTTMEMLDLIDIQRVRHPKLRKFTCESKSLRLKSRIDFFLIAKDLTVNIKKSEILPAIAPDHNAIFISLTLPNKCPRGPGFWKFNNTLLKDPQFIDKIRYTYTQACAYYGHLTDRRLLWEVIKIMWKLDRLRSRIPKTSPKALEIGRRSLYGNSTISMAQYAITSPSPILMECYGSMMNLKRTSINL